MRCLLIGDDVVVRQKRAVGGVEELWPLPCCNEGESVVANVEYASQIQAARVVFEHLSKTFRLRPC